VEIVIVEFLVFVDLVKSTLNLSPDVRFASSSPFFNAEWSLLSSRIRPACNPVFPFFRGHEFSSLRLVSVFRLPNT